MKCLNGSKIRFMLVVFMAAIVLSGGSAKADYTWVQKADMPTPRMTHTSAVVNGKIYVIGGATSESESAGWMPLSTVEEYDPATDSWTRKVDMPTARCDMVGSSAVVDGKIYVIGGDIFDGNYLCISTVEEYDPATDTWTRKADMPTPRWSLATCAVDGKIYAIGGAPADSFNALNVMEQYDPITDTWSRKASMPIPVWGLCACVINGKIYAIGGRIRYGARPFVQEYDPATDTWTQKSDMPQKTSQMVSIVLGNKIVVIGGWNYSGLNPHVTMQIYDPETDTWTLEEDVSFLRAMATGEVVNNKIYLIGGTDRPHPCPALSTVYEYGPLVDYNGDGIVDINDLVIMIDNWGTDDSLCDIGPMPWGDGVVDAKDLLVLAEYMVENIGDVNDVQ